MTAFADLHKSVMVEAPGVPGPFVYPAMIRTARDLCEKARIWKDAVETVSMVSGTAEVALGIPDTADLVSLEYIRFNGHELEQTSERELSQYSYDWRIATGDPTHVFTIMRDVPVARVWPTPARNLANAFTLECYIKPKTDQTTLEAFICEQFGETLRNGTLYELFRMSGRPWSNPDFANHCRIRYRNGVYEARGEMLLGYASQSLNISPEPLF